MDTLKEEKYMKTIYELLKSNENDELGEFKEFRSYAFKEYHEYRQYLKTFGGLLWGF